MPIGSFLQYFLCQSLMPSKVPSHPLLFPSDMLWEKRTQTVTFLTGGGGGRCEDQTSSHVTIHFFRSLQESARKGKWCAWGWVGSRGRWIGPREGELWFWSFQTSLLLSPNLHAWEPLTTSFFFLAYLEEHGSLDL